MFSWMILNAGRRPELLSSRCLVCICLLLTLPLLPLEDSDLDSTEAQDRMRRVRLLERRNLFILATRTRIAV